MKADKPTVGQAVMEIEGLVNEEVSKLVKGGDMYLADFLNQSIHVIKENMMRINHCEPLSTEEVSALKKKFVEAGIELTEASVDEGKADIMSNDPNEILKALLNDNFKVK